MEALGEVVVGATRRDFVATIVDENDEPVNLSGVGASAKLQGRSTDTPLVTIDLTGTLTDPSQGVVTFPSIGSLVTQAQLTTAAVKRSTYKLRVKYTDSAAKIDFTTEFLIIWSQDPLQPA